MRRMALSYTPCCVITVFLSAAAYGADAPVQAVFLGRSVGKPPLTFHSVRLTLENRNDKPVWFVLPYWGDKAIPEKGVFPNKNWNGPPFEGHEYQGDGGSAFEVYMFGGNGFKAFRLPAKGRIELDRYTVEAWQEIKEIVVLEATDLKVNGKTPLEKWLPYGITSGDKVKVKAEAFLSSKYLDWDAEKSRKRDDYPKEKVDDVKAEGITSWTVKFQDKRP